MPYALSRMRARIPGSSAPLAVVLLVVALAGLGSPSAASADEAVGACPGSGNLFAPWASGLWSATDGCPFGPGYGYLIQAPNVNANTGRGAGFHATVPA